MIAISFSAFLAVIFLLGISSTFRARQSRQDYYLASSSVSPLLTALSAVATLNSGYVFIGLIGFTYVAGLHAIWLMVGWIVGDFLASLFVYRQLRVASERTGEVSFAAVLAAWHGAGFSRWRRIAAIITVLFLISYAAAQVAAGGKSFFAVLDLAPEIGAAITAAIVLAYSAAGGIRASIWTDAAQFVVMFIAMSVLIFVGIDRAGGLHGLYQTLAAIPGYLDLYPANPLIPGFGGLALFVIGWVFAGLSIVGQPHIMVRYMALESPEKIAETRIWYFSFYFAFVILAHGAGLIARVLLPDLGDLDPELALPSMARMLLPDVLVGLILAGVFAATMSTVDSLVLSCSAAITNDLVPRSWERRWMRKSATAMVTLLALGLALMENQSVFNLVILSWSTLGSAFAPLLIVYALGRRTREPIAIGAMLAGVSTALLWRGAGLHEHIYEGLPGILIGLVIVFVASEPLPAGGRQFRAVPGTAAEN